MSTLLTSTNRVVDILLWVALGIVTAVGVGVLLYLLGWWLVSDYEGRPDLLIGEIVCALIAVVYVAIRGRS
jgi:hypothetical protein